jgi:soluble lytic murein transglycosylase
MPDTMRRFRFLIRLLGVLAVGLAAAPTGAAASDLAAQRAQFPAVLALAERGPADSWKRLAAGLEDYPLFPYLEYTALRRGKAPLQREAVDAYLARFPDTLPARDLRNAYLRQLAADGDWAGFRGHWQDTPDRDLRCAWQRARIAAGEKPVYAGQIEPLWMQPRATPGTCDPLFEWARSNGVIDDAAVWQRLLAAAEAGNPETAAAIAAYLPPAQRSEGQRIASAVRDPGTVLAKANTWPDQPRNRDAIAYGLARHARRNSAGAETLWAGLADRFRWDAEQKNRVLNALAVFRSTSYSPDALTRLKALPIEAGDDASREWHVRVALAGGDWTETLAALDRLSDTQQADARWRYLRARTLVKLDRERDARPLFAALANEANFHGFLAADWLDAPYAICPLSLEATPAQQQAIAAQPDLARAFEFHALGKLTEARREWDYALTRIEPAERAIAAERAYREGWYDRAVFALSASPETLRLYEQRFPLAQESRVLREARDAQIEPAWAYAIIRAESAWMPDARSHADAYGLMQLLPGVAKQVAQTYKLPYGGAGDLFDPGLNIQLGTRFLAQMARQYSGSPWLASAAYNAGGAPVGRWIGARGTLEPDFFIETIPYKETREYVARVMAFAVIYDWRLNGRVVPLSARLPRIGESYRPPAEDGARKAVVCPAPAGTPAAAPPSTGGD